MCALETQGAEHEGLFDLFTASIAHSLTDTDEPEWTDSCFSGRQDGSYILYDPKMPGSSQQPSALTSTSLASRLGLWIHTEFHIVICSSCGIAWKPMNILGHLKKAHKIKMKKKDEEEVVSWIHSYGITDSSLVGTPMPRFAPVELIKVHQDGHCCNICDYCCPSLRSFENHWSRNHQKIKVKPSKRFHRSDIQTFFDPVPVKYFEVSTCLQQVPISSAFDIYIKKELPNQQSFQPTIPLKEREIPPFLHVTQWHTHLAGYLTNDVRRKELRDMVRLPKGLQTSDLHSVVIQYMQSVSRKACELPYQLRCLLIECPRCVSGTIDMCRG
jgi:Orsellinic acid/F9775 biosynthesis cluster protein D